MTLYIYGWFEALAVVLLCLSLLGVTWKAPKVAIVTTILFGGTLLARTLPLAFGAHSLLSIIILALLLALFFSKSIAMSLIAAGCSMVVLVFFETCNMFVLKYLLTLNDNIPVVWLLSRLPVVLLVLAAALLLSRKKLALLAQ